MRFFHDLLPVKVYTLSVPQDFKRPSMYFPTPTSFDSSDTVSTFLKTYTLNVNIFHDDSQQAYSAAERIADVVRAKRSVIPLINRDGHPEDGKLRISSIETRVGEMGVATIALQWDSRYNYERDPVPSVEDFQIDSGVKE